MKVEARLDRVPLRFYTDPDTYRQEQERIFGGPSWSYVGLGAEVPEAGDFKVTWVGDRQVVLVRDDEGDLWVWPNRCAHRGTALCREPFGHAEEFVCPYHQWVYDLRGTLIGVPFRRGVKGQGGMPEDFCMEANGLPSLAVAERNGVVFASFDDAAPNLNEYLGDAMLPYFDRVFGKDGLVVLGYERQRIPANWKLLFENIKDPYHATLLHAFLVTFGLFRADQPSETRMDSTGRHSVLVSRRGEQAEAETVGEMRSFRDGFRLYDQRLLDIVREFPGEATVVMQTLWPNLIVQQQSNTLATRQIIPRAPGVSDLVWTFFGYVGDDDEMRMRRLRQANLMGPGGFVSIDDSEVMRLAQQAIEANPDGEALVEMGGRDTADAEHMATEAAIRAFYRYYREVMGL